MSSNTDNKELEKSKDDSLHGAGLIHEMGLWKVISEDFNRHDRNLALPGFQAMMVYRYGTWTQTLTSSLLRKIARIPYKLIYLFIRNIYGIEIRDTVKLGRRFRVGHQSGIVIHDFATFGDDCLVRQNVTLGIGVKWHGEQGPVIGNHVEFGAGAVVLDNITIGNNVMIGPNCVIIKNIPDNRTVFISAPSMLVRKPLT